MNGLIITLGDYNNDGRLRELIKSLELIKTIKSIDLIGPISIKEIKGTVKTHSKSFNLDIYKGRRKMINYYININRYIKSSIKKYDFVLLDNFTVAFLGQKIKKLNPKIKVIIDSRELYFPETMSSPFSKWLVKKEHKQIKKSEAVIVANEYRANILKEKYNLGNIPYSYENIRFLGKLVKKEKNNNDKKIIISSGGLFFKRDLMKILEDFSKLNKEIFEMHIYGGASNEDIILFKSFQEKFKTNNIIYKGKLPLEELYYKILEADIGLVHYHQRDLNNINCASGKVYEYLGCGIPVLTTENIPLKQMCENHLIGIATNSNYDKSIKELIREYDFYLNNIELFLENADLDVNAKLADYIESKLMG